MSPQAKSNMMSYRNFNEMSLTSRWKPVSKLVMKVIASWSPICSSTDFKPWLGGILGNRRSYYLLAYQRRWFSLPRIQCDMTGFSTSGSDYISISLYGKIWFSCWPLSNQGVFCNIPNQGADCSHRFCMIRVLWWYFYIGLGPLYPYQPK